MTSLKSLIPKLVALFERHAGLMAVLAFASGVASFLLVERRETYAQVIALLMLASWVWLLLENWLRVGLLRRFGVELPPVLMRYATQLVQQESFFFVLPFFLAATTWSTGQAGFTLLLILCALLSLIDPLYYRQLAPRRSLFIVFHAFSLFALLLVVLPLILHLTTGESLLLALVLALLFSLPSLGRLLPFDRWWRLPLLALLLVALAATLWQLRGSIPPATLRLVEVALTRQVDPQQRAPGSNLREIDAATLHRKGLYAWTAVRAPRGLQEQIHHLWLHDGALVDRITLDIRGGRTEGYRAWTHKRNFPADPVGHWQLRVVTDSGQLIGLANFTVTGGVVDSNAATLQPPSPNPGEKSETLPVPPPARTIAQPLPSR